MAKKYFFSQSSKCHEIRCWSVTDGWSNGWSRKYRSLREGAPPPIHQSTTHRTALRPSSLPPFPRPRSAMPFNVSNAFVLCTGLAWTSKVSALSLSDKVPFDRIVFRKWVSEVLFPVNVEDAWYVSVSFSKRDAARWEREAIWEDEGLGSGFGWEGSGRVAVYQCALAENNNLPLPLLDLTPVTASVAAGTSAGDSGAGSFWFLAFFWDLAFGASGRWTGSSLFLLFDREAEFFPRLRSERNLETSSFNFGYDVRCDSVNLCSADS